MKTHRFIGPYGLKSGPYELDQPEVVRQITKILRHKPGEEFILCDGNNREARAKIISMGPRNLNLSLDMPMEVKVRPQSQITLYCAVLKKENFDLVVQKATELGVTSIVPILARRTVKQNLNLTRLQAIALEAAELSGRGTVPKVGSPLAWGQTLDHAEANDTNIIFDAGQAAISKNPTQGDRIGLFIGPEGGWQEDELADTRDRSFHTAGLGPMTLRAETAAMVAVYSMVTWMDSPLSELPSAK
jgi:16S rRNA (uracil1498-N3)-methyltransferase